MFPPQWSMRITSGHYFVRAADGKEFTSKKIAKEYIEECGRKRGSYKKKAGGGRYEKRATVGGGQGQGVKKKVADKDKVAKKKVSEREIAILGYIHN